jgi:DNA-binding MarR family transcriptional regulator
VKTTRGRIEKQCAVAAAQCAGNGLRRASRAITQLYAKILAPSGLQPTQFSLLVACAVAGEVSMAALADALAMDRTTLTRNLRPLERRHLVTVAEGEDRRVRKVTLTTLGRAILADALPLWNEAQARVIKAFGERRLSRTLQEVAALETLAREEE